MLPFRTLSGLAGTITRNKIKQIDILREAGDMSRRVNKLYNGLLKKVYNSDNEAAQDIFGKNEDYIQYRKLRIKLFDMLVNTSFFSDGNLSKFPEVGRAHFNCYRNFAAANILLNISAQDAAAYLLKRVLEKSIKYEFTSLTAEVSWLLRTRIKNITDKKEMIKYVKINELYEKKRRLEMDATIAYEELIQFFMGGRSTNKEIYEQSGKSFTQLFAMAKEVDTAQFYFLTYNLGVAHYMAGNDCKNALQLCLQAIEHIEARGNYHSGKIAPFAANALACYTQLKITDTKETRRVIKMCYDLSPEFGINRIKVLEAELQHYLYARKYDDALLVYQKANSHPRKPYLKGANAEIWKIYAAYFYLLSKLNLIDIQSVASVIGDIDADLIDYEIKEFKKEKEGMNIPVLMLPVLVGLVEDQIEGHVRTREALVQYAKRYLKKKKNMRSAAMLDALLAVDNYQFQKKANIRVIQKTIKLFNEVPIELSEQSSAIEILPYETLLEEICKRRNIPVEIN